MQLQASLNPCTFSSSSLHSVLYSLLVDAFYNVLKANGRKFVANIIFDHVFCGRCVACSFDAIISADLFENLKPAPDMFLAAAKSLGLQPHEVH